jgi:hypothetical protein
MKYLFVLLPLVFGLVAKRPCTVSYKLIMLTAVILQSCVEAGSNTSTVALRVLGGNERGTQCLGV